jgi:Fe-S cluster assembly protein SufD
MSENVTDAQQAISGKIGLHAWFTQEQIPSGELEAITSMRRNAWNSFLRQTLPSRKNETWKRVDFANIPLENYKSFISMGNGAGANWVIENLGGVNAAGVIVETIKDGIQKYPLIAERTFVGSIDPDQDIFAAMSAAFADDGVFIYVPEGIEVKDIIRIHLNKSTKPGMLYNHLIVLEDNTRAQIIMDEISAYSSDSNKSMSIGNIGIHLGVHANLRFISMDIGNELAWKITHEKALLMEDSQLEWLVYTVDGGFSKKFIQVDLLGRGASAKMVGLFLTAGEQQVEFNTRQNHEAPDTKSDLLYKGVLLDGSRSLFSGMIHVSPNAVKSDGYQVNRNLIIGETAHADTLPGLEILTDDVRCTHGATVGKIDPTEQFYLQTRGMDARDAQRLIIQGFLDPIIQMLPDEGQREILYDKIDHKLD